MPEAPCLLSEAPGHCHKVLRGASAPLGCAARCPVLRLRAGAESTGTLQHALRSAVARRVENALAPGIGTMAFSLRARLERVRRGQAFPADRACEAKGAGIRATAAWRMPEMHGLVASARRNVGRVRSLETNCVGDAVAEPY
jgi:hypothetical protein